MDGDCGVAFGALEYEDADADAILLSVAWSEEAALARLFRREEPPPPLAPLVPPPRVVFDFGDLPAFPPVPAALRVAVEKSSHDIALLDSDPLRWQALRESFVLCGGMLFRRTPVPGDVVPLVIDGEEAPPPPPPSFPPPAAVQRRAGQQPAAKRKPGQNPVSAPRPKRARDSESDGHSHHPRRGGRRC